METKIQEILERIYGKLNSTQIDLIKALKIDQSFSEWVEELNNPPNREFSYNRKDLLPIIGTFGTVADSTRRQQMYNLGEIILQDLGLDGNEIKSMIYDPSIKDGNREQKDIINESQHLMNDSVILYGLESKYSSIGSMAELGFLAAFSLLKARKSIIFIKDTDLNLGEDISRTRSMSIIDAQFIKKTIPESFIFYKDKLKAMTHSFDERMNFIEFLASPIFVQVNNILKNDRKLKNQVCISGNSKSVDNERRSLHKGFDKLGIDYIETIRDDWNLEIYETKELPLKNDSLINIVYINDHKSYGALKDVGLAIFRSIVFGSYSLIYLPDHDDKDYIRAKGLIMSHWKKLSSEYPWVRHFIRFTDSQQEMIINAHMISKNTVITQTLDKAQ